LRPNARQTIRLRPRCCRRPRSDPRDHRTVTCASRLGKGLTHDQHLAALRCWQRVGQAEDGNRRTCQARRQPVPRSTGRSHSKWD